MTANTKNKVITHFNQLNLEGYYTYADYLTWQFKDRIELIKGKLFKMSPAPNLDHQIVSSNLIDIISVYFSNRKCKWIHAPFDVRFPSKHSEMTDTVVQPDLCVVCDLKKLDKQGCNGAPDLVVEILSSGNTQKEMNDKFLLYKSALAKEHWLVHPQDKWLIIYHLNGNNKYVGSKPFTPKDGVIQSILFKDLSINLNKVFDLFDVDDSK